MLIPSVLNSGILSQRRYAAILYSAIQQKWNSHVNTIERNSFLLLDLAFQHFLFFHHVIIILLSAENHLTVCRTAAVELQITIIEQIAH